jgi:hypothetical protein
LKIRALAPGRQLGLAALLLVSAAAAVLGYHAFRQKLDSFQPLGFEPVGRADHWEVRTVSPALAGALAPGDRIVLVNGVEPGRIEDLRRLLRASASSQLLVLRGEELQSVSYRRPPVEVDLPWLALAFLGAIYLAIGLHTLWRTRDGQLFYAWCLASAALYLFSPVFPVDRVGVWIYLGDELARLFLPPLTLHLFLSIPRAAIRRRAAPALLYLPAAVLAAIQCDLALADGALFAGRPTPALLFALDRIELLHLAAFATTAIVVLARRLGSVASWEQQRQLLWLVVGTAAGYAPFLLGYGVPYIAGLRPGETAATLAVLPLAFVPVAFGWAVLRYRLWDLGLIVRNGAAHVLALIVGVGAFALLDLALRRAIPDDASLTRDLATFFGGLAIVGLVIPAHRRIHGALERLQYGSAFRRRRGLGGFGQELLHERDLDRLCEALLGELEVGLELSRANLLLVQGGQLVAVRPERELPHAAAAAAIAPALWTGRFEVLAGVALPGETDRLEHRLYAAGYRYLFPLTVREARVGLVVTGFRGDGEPLDSDDVELVRELLDQAALAIENAQLLDQVQRQLETVVALQRHSEGILESSPAGIAVLAPGEVVVTANLAFAALVGRPRSEVVGRPLGALLALGALPRPGAPLVQVDCTDALGRRRHLEVSVAPLQPAAGGDRRVLVLQDVTDRVAMEEALKEKDRLASLGVLAAGVAHEVNTPLTGISSYAQLLLAETASDDPRRPLLEKVEKQTFRASRIVSNLLEFARKPGVERRPVDLGALLAETAELLRERLAAKSVRLVFARPAESLRVVGSEGELQQVFTNLMLNAIDAMAPLGGGELALALLARGGRARVEVADEGPGIAEAARDRIFQPFFTTKRGAGGTGLGLSISFSIVQQHGGTIGFENRAPRGCRFTVELPLAPPAEPEAS